jgi:putative CocE/NonD family hydrolase
MAQSKSVIEETKVQRDVRISTRDPHVTLSADIFMPASEGPFPAIITLLPYRNDAASGIECGALLRWFAARGYACVLVDFRGTGSSDGMQRPPFDPCEADDGVDVISWVTAQPWCNGKIGMWGMSYGAILTLRTASRQPKGLSAIVAIEGMLDPERDFVHPAANAGCLGSLAMWGTETLLNQLLPPLHQFSSEKQQARWCDRRENFEPWLMDLARHGPGHTAWRSRAIDASTIVTPSFFIAGWRDLFCDPTIRAYETTQAPKKLLVGPWMHTFPDMSPFEPIDFRSLILRWWDYWLRDLPTGVLEEPRVTLFVQGGEPEWRCADNWPPVVDPRFFMASGKATLMTVPRGQDTSSGQMKVIANWKMDATVGSLSGLWGLPTSGFGLPLNQHDDDVRCVSFVTPEFVDELVLVGRPTVRVQWLDNGQTPRRLVARLTDVDEDARSTLITMGVVAEASERGQHTVALNPTCYRIAAGHRLKVVLGDADFPRLWPEPNESDRHNPPKLCGFQLEIPEGRFNPGSTTTISKPDISSFQDNSLVQSAEPIWEITRYPLNNAISASVGQHLIALTPNREHLLEMTLQASARVKADHPDDAVATCGGVATARMLSGTIIVVRVDSLLTRSSAYAAATISMDDKPLFAKKWQVCTEK